MIKLAILALVPALAATFYTQQPLSSPTLVNLRESGAGEEQDRQFLASLSLQEASRNIANRMDQQFLANLQEQDRLAAAAGREEIPVMRAIPIEHALPATSTPIDMPEVQRAVAVASPTNLRNAFHQPFVTMIEPEVRLATALGQRR